MTPVCARQMAGRSRQACLPGGMLCPYEGKARGERAEGVIGVFTSASPRCLDGGDVDLLHRHHRLEGTLCLTATSRKRIG